MSEKSALPIPIIMIDIGRCDEATIASLTV